MCLGAVVVRPAAFPPLVRACVWVCVVVIVAPLDSLSKQTNRSRLPLENTIIVRCRPSRRTPLALTTPAPAPSQTTESSSTAAPSGGNPSGPRMSGTEIVLMLLPPLLLVLLVLVLLLVLLIRCCRRRRSTEPPVVRSSLPALGGGDENFGTSSNSLPALSSPQRKKEGPSE